MATKDEEERLRSVALESAQSVSRAHRGAEEALLKQSELLRVTLASIGDAVISTDTEARVKFMNGVAQSHTGWSEADAIGQPLETVFRIVNEQTRVRAENPATRVLREGVIVGLANHTILLVKDGTERPIDDSAAPIRDADGHVAGCVVIFRDITERRKADRALQESEARKAAMLQAALDCVITIDHEGRIIEFNPAAERTFGRRREEVMGEQMADLIIPTRLRERHRQGFAHYLATGEGPVIDRRIEMPALRTDGTELIVELGITRIHVEGPPMFTAYLRDITERKHLEEDLKNRNEELAEADKSKSQFIAMLSHELRSPLNAIRGWIQILKRPGATDEEFRMGLEVIDRTSKAQAELISDLLDIHGIAAGKIRLELAPVDLREVIDSAVNAIVPAAMAKEIRVDREMEPAPVIISGDPARLQQVLNNLLGNAVKFTPKGGRIRVLLRPDSAYANVVVSDTGQGISAAALPHIFEQFRQADPRISRYEGGLGLGLAISKQLVELHGGTISARSPGAGKGAAFAVSLPLLLAGAIRPPVRTEKAAAESVSLGGIFVLLVDDEVDAREPLRRVLESAGAETIAVASVDEALDVIAQRRPDVIVSDIAMPGRDGYDLMRSVRAMPAARDRRVPAIALTAYAATEDRDRAMSVGFQKHMAKPVEQAELIAAVASLASGRSLPGSW